MDIFEPENKVKTNAAPARISVLLLDDVDDLRYVLTEVLEVLGYEVTACEGGEPALNILKNAERLPNLIICDISMPGMDGYMFFRAVRANEAWNGIYFVFMSGSKDDRRAALQHGADDYVAKPFPVADLQVVLEKYRVWRDARDG